MRNKILAAAALAVAAAALAGVATAGRSAKPKQQRIAIVQRNDKFVLTPLTAGPIQRDTGTSTACCWTRDIFTRDGQSTEIDDPTVTFTSKRGTFTWKARITFVDLDNDFTVATAVWKIVKGTGAYAHLAGHGRQAFVSRTDGNSNLADKAEGLMGLGS